MSTYSDLDIVVLTFKNHFCLFEMELCQSGADSYLIQILKWTLESWEFIVGNFLPVSLRFYNPSDIFSKLGLSRGRNLKEMTLTFRKRPWQ